MDTKTGKFLNKKYQVKVLPTLLFLDFNGNIIHKTTGFKDSEELIRLGKIALNPANNLHTLHSRYKKGERSDEFIKSYMDKLKSVKDEKYKEVFNWYFNYTPKKYFLNKKGFEYLIQASEIGTTSFEFIVANKSVFENIIGKSEYRNQIFKCFVKNLTRLSKNLTDINENKKKIRYIEEKLPEVAQMAKDYKEVAKLMKVPDGFEAFAIKKIDYVINYWNNNADSKKQISMKILVMHSKIENKKVFEDALNLIEEAIDSQKENIPYKYLDIKAGLLCKLGKKNKAKKVFREALKITPKHDPNKLISKRFINSL